MSVKKTLLMLIDEHGDRAYGWDGDGALPIRRDVMDLVRQMFHDPEFDSDRLERCRDYTVQMGRDGTIEVALGFACREVLLCFQCGSAVTYVQFFEDEETTLDGLIRIRHPSEAVKSVQKFNELLRWLMREDR